MDGANRRYNVDQVHGPWTGGALFLRSMVNRMHRQGTRDHDGGVMARRGGASPARIGIELGATADGYRGRKRERSSPRSRCRGS